MQSSPILVLGASGKTGSRICRKLTDGGFAVRRGSRSASIPFDWDDEATWGAAVDGVSAVYVCYFPDIAMPGAVERVERFCALAKAAGVGRLVLLSGRGEHEAERGEEVVRNAGVDFTIVRAAWFAQNFSEGIFLEQVMCGAIAMPGGDVREPIIDVDDIADVAVAALTEDGHAGQLYEVTGPRLLSFVEMAETLSTASGRPVRHVPITFDEFHDGIAQAAGSEMADLVTAIARETMDGRNAHVTDGVRRALGREPRDFADFARDAAAAGIWAEAA